MDISAIDGLMWRLLSDLSTPLKPYFGTLATSGRVTYIGTLMSIGDDGKLYRLRLSLERVPLLGPPSNGPSAKTGSSKRRTSRSRRKALPEKGS